MKYPTHLFVPLTWYKLNEEGGRCPLEYRKSVLPYVIGPLQFEWIKNYSAVADTGIVSYYDLALYPAFFASSKKNVGVAFVIVLQVNKVTGYKANYVPATDDKVNEVMCHYLGWISV